MYYFVVFYLMIFIYFSCKIALIGPNLNNEHISQSPGHRHMPVVHVNRYHAQCESQISGFILGNPRHSACAHRELESFTNK